MKLEIPPYWKSFLKEITTKKSFLKLENFLKKEYQEKEIFPKEENIFKALTYFPPEKTKVVIIGQDPYHTPGIAEGLAFSIPEGKKILPSVKNIFKEIESDLKIKKNFNDADLKYLAEQEVLLLNQVLTVEAHKPGSHWKKGWENFTAQLIQKLSRENNNLVFLLWGKNAQEIEPFIENKEKHLILKATHPSPFSAYRGFFGCKHFSKTNQYLKKHNKKEIKW